jgi:aspartyl-tRNA(Asn)/glutamyl-tRNA(Gln) amidotransferase subunit A
VSAPRTIEGTVEAIRSGARTAVGVAEDALARIERIDGELGSFHETCDEDALARAAEIDRAIADGADVGPLAGVPIALKDNIVTRVGTTTCGSRILEGYRSPYDATAAQRLADAGAIVLGKTSCDEFAMGSSNEHCAYGPARNPWDPARVPGGSSGGSAAAVAAGLCPAALGSDTGGSVRQPAALCGVVGVKPSYGRVSRYGLVAYGSSLDQIGPFTTSVRDAALVLSLMAGGDRNDSTSADVPVPDYLASVDEPIDGLRIGVVPQHLAAENDPAVNDAMHAAVETFRGLGAEIVEIDLELTDYGIATYYVLATAEASSNLARYDGIRYGLRSAMTPDDDLDDLYARSRAEGFGDEVQRRIMLGTYVLSAGYYDAYYDRALRVRRLIRREFDAAFERCHALIGPTSPMPAFRLGEKADPLTMYLCDVYTIAANIAGHCAVSVPAGHADVDGSALPIGLQVQCRAFDETTLFRVARMFEASTDFASRRPPVAEGIGT